MPLGGVYTPIHKGTVVIFQKKLMFCFPIQRQNVARHFLGIGLR